MKYFAPIALVIIGISAFTWLFQYDDKRQKQEPTSAKPGEHLLALEINNNRATQNSNEKLTSARAFEENSARLLNCFEQENCDYPQTDPKSYYFAVGDDMKTFLSEVKQSFAIGDLTGNETREIAHKFLRVPNGHVQSKAIEILESLPVSEDTYKVLELALQDNFDSVLLLKSLSLLTNYHQHGFSHRIDNMFQSLISSGGHFVRQNLSSRLLPFINEDNVESYRLTASRMSADSLECRQLNTTLNEYQLLMQGG